MNLICSSLLDAWRSTIWPTCRYLFKQYVVAPVRGLIDIGSGLLLAVPDLFDAAKQLILGQLTAEARYRVQQGINQIARGWALVQMPLLVLVLVVAFGWDGLVLAISVGSLMPA